MFKNNAICQFQGSVSLLNIFNPFYFFPAACVTSLIYCPIVAMKDTSFIILKAVYIALIIITILLTIAHFYVRYNQLISKLNFIITNKGLIQKSTNDFYLIPWCNVDSITEWKTPYGWQISINTKSTDTANSLFQDKAFLVDNLNAPFCLKKNKSAYLQKIHTFMDNTPKSETLKLDKFKPFKFIKTKIIGDTLMIYTLATLVGIILGYFS
ncbi:MAG: hypothetical protein R3Y32_05490 [Bacillota bacterium]